jgi:hypothetical protein
MAGTSGTVSVDGDVSGLKRALSDGRTAMSGFETHAKTALSQIDDAITQIGSTLSSLESTADQLRLALNLVGMAGAAAGLIAVFNKVKQAAKEWADAGEDARKRGITVETMSELKYAAEEFNIKNDDLKGGLEKFAGTMREVRTEGHATAESVKEWSAPLYDALTKAPDQRTALLAVADAMKAQGDQAQNAALAQTLFGKEHATLIHMLGQGSQSLGIWADAARKAGTVMDSETAEGAMRLTQALDLLARSPLAVTIERNLVAIARAAGVAAGSFEAMTTKELEAEIGRTEAKIRQLESAVRDGADAANTATGEFKSFADSYRLLVSDIATGLGVKKYAAPVPTDEVKVELEKLQTLLAQEKSLMDWRKGWLERQKAIEDLDAPKSPKTDTSSVEKWLSDLEKRTLTAQQNTFALIENERKRDLEKFNEYLEAKSISDENAARARLLIEQKYAAEMRKEFDKLYVQPVTTAISSDLERAFSDWLTTGKFSWQDLANSIIADIAKIALRMAVLQPLFGGGAGGGTGMVGNLATGLSGLLTSAQGNAFDMGNVVPFASGGIVERPSIFGMRDGVGLMGEAGPEAILPLSRGSDGRLGVQAGSGGNVTHVTFNVSTPDASSFRRSQGQIAAQLSRAVAAGQRNR